MVDRGIREGEPWLSSTGPADVLVIFGITGDLAKKMTFVSLYRLERRDELSCPIVGVAIDDLTDDQLRDHARAAIEGAGETRRRRGVRRDSRRDSPTSRATTPMPARISVSPITWHDVHRPTFYLEIPPSLFARVVEGLHGAGLTAPRAS